MRATFFTPPVLRRPLRKTHDAIICAVREHDLARAERLFNGSPKVYQAVTHLLVCWHKIAKTVN